MDTLLVLQVLVFSPVTSLFAWRVPRLFLFLLRTVAIVNLLVVVAIWGLRWGVTDYLHMNYVAHNQMVIFLLFYTWCFLTGILVLWARMDQPAGWPWIILIIVANVMWWTQPLYPTERVLRVHFLKHQAAFEQLVAMVQADLSGLSVADSSGAGINELAHSSPQRLAVYKRVLGRLGLDQYGGLEFNEDELSLIYSSREGFGEGANGYTYIFSSRVPTPLVSWEEPDPDFSAFKEWYRPLVQQWYLVDGKSQVVMP